MCPPDNRCLSGKISVECGMVSPESASPFRAAATFVACSPSDLLFFVGRGVNIVVRWPFLLPFPQHLVCLQILINVGCTSEGTALRHPDHHLVIFRGDLSLVSKAP